MMFTGQEMKYTKTQPIWIDIKELMERYRISQTMAYQLVHSKGFPAKKICGRWKIKVSGLEAWEETI